MSSNKIETKIVLEGEKEYRKAISQINSDLKVLSSEMGKVTAEFGKNDKSVDGLTQRNKVLSDQIEKQKEKVSTLKGALAESSEKYGENDKKTNAWQVSLNKAEAELIGMEKELKNNEKALDNVDDSLQDTTKDTDKTAEGVEELGDELDDTGKKSSTFADVLKANLVSDTIKAGLKGLVEGIKTVANAIADVILKPGFDRAMNIEQAQFKLKGLGHDAQAVDDIMQNALASVKGTAYGLDDAATVAASAVAAGIEPGQELERTLKLVSDASAIAGSGLSEMGGIFNKVASAGKISAQEINQLNERGIPITQLLAETMNVSAEEVKNLVSAGKVGFPEFQAAIEQGMGGAALTMGQTFEGASANVMAAFSRLGAGIMTPFTTALTPALGVVMSIIDDVAGGTTENIQSKTQQLGEMLKNAVSSLLSGLAPMLNSLLEIIKQILPEIAKILPDLVQTGMELVMNLVGGIVQAIPSLMPAVTQMINTIIVGLVDMLPALTLAAIEIVVVLANGISGVLPTLIPAVVSAVLLIAQTLIDNIDILLQATIDLLMSLVKAVPEVIKVLMPKIPEIITSVVNALVENIPILLTGAIDLFMALVQAIPEIVVVLIQNLPQIVMSIINGLAQLPTLIWAILTECISKFFDWGTESEEAGEEGSTGFLDTVINIIKELPTKVWEWLQNTINKLGEFFGQIIPLAGNKAKEFLNSFINIVKNLPNDIWNSIIGSVSKVSEWGSQMLAKAKTAATNVFNGIVDTLKSLPSQLLSIGKNIVEGLWNGISNATNWLMNKVKDFAKGIMNGIKSALGIASPSKLMRDEVGKNLALGLGEGFVDEMKIVNKEIQNVLPTDFDLDMNTDLNNNLNSFENGSITGLSSEYLIEAFQQALIGMKILIDGDKVGELVTDQVEKVVFN